MNIVVACKLVPDDQDIIIADDGSLDYSKARSVISLYDKNALEGAANLAAANEGSTAVVVSVGTPETDDSKLKKDILARGMDELRLITDEGARDLDAYGTAQALKSLVEGLDAWDVVVCGDGSADDFAQQVDVQLAAALDVPCVNGVVALEALDGGAALKCTRLLENEQETVKVPLPAVVSVSPEIALPRICGMKDILAAGKKPQQVLSAADAGVELASGTEVQEVKAPPQTPRQNQVFDFATQGIDGFADAVREALR